MLIIAILFIFAACILYTLGVWSERIIKRLKVWHAVVLWLGFICDTIGTGAMGKLAGSLIQFPWHDRPVGYSFNVFSCNLSNSCTN